MFHISYKIFYIIFGALLLMTISSHSYAVDKMSIAYLAYSKDYWQVWIMDKEANRHRQISTTAYDKTHISWYPNGEYILVNGTQGQLTKISVKTGVEVKLYILDRAVTDAVISPDGKYIAYSLSTGKSQDQNDIWIYDIENKKHKKQTVLPYLQHEPVWSWNSKKIFFLSGRGKQNHDIWSIDFDGNNLQQLTYDSLYHFDVAVNEDDHVLFSSNRDGNYEIYRYINSKKIIRETINPGLDASPAWGAGGDEIYFESTHTNGIPNIFRKNLNTGELVKITNLKHGARAPVVYHRNDK